MEGRVCFFFFIFRLYGDLYLRLWSPLGVRVVRRWMWLLWLM
jgi:hypothetical protein